MKLITLTIDDYDIAGPSYAITCEEAKVEVTVAQIEAVIGPDWYKIEVLNVIDANNRTEFSEMLEELKNEHAELVGEEDADGGTTR